MITDLAFNAYDGRLLDSLKIACDKFTKDPDPRISEFRQLPPVLMLEGKFTEYNIAWTLSRRCGVDFNMTYFPNVLTRRLEQGQFRIPFLISVLGGRKLE